MAAIEEATRQRAFSLCGDFLGGMWKSISYEEFNIEHISGGLSNLLYLCSLPEKVKTREDEPSKVLLRLYGRIIQENPETVITDSVIFSLLAEKQMGPRLYGVFTGGRVEEYIKSRHLYTEELHQPDISVACARVMARFHQLTMPLVKEPRWLFDVMTRYLDEALNNMSFDNPDADKAAKLQKIMSYGLASELTCLRNLLGQVNSPVVFCHNDMQEGNILYCDEDKGWQVLPIDFEYSSYNYRGFDFGNHFCEWCYDYSVETPPYYSAKIENYPNREQQLRFVRAYLEEGGMALDSPEMRDEEERLLLEANAFALASHFMWGLWSIVQSQMSHIQFGYLDYAIARFEAYFLQKAQVVPKIQRSTT